MYYSLGTFEDFLPYGVIDPYYNLGNSSNAKKFGALFGALGISVGAYLYLTKGSRRVSRMLKRFSTAKQAENWAKKERDREPEGETQQEREARLDEVEAALDAAEYLR